ncbi:MAG TPA: RagB/SusD family nutrient uptake outer membrane protein [Bacteroidales bacterium]|nr:RagB/SusD family nutrient uptake outer membrane protein [Bacteroidales bacterium]
MKKSYITLLIVLALFGLWGNSCKQDFLTVAPAGSLDQSLLLSAKGVDALLVGAYSMIDGYAEDFGSGWEATSTNWVFGSIRGLEANKGTDAGDQPDINSIQTFSEDANNPYLNWKWRSLYEGISRSNAVITVTNKSLAAGKITESEATSFIKQARALRGWYHFEAWRMWEKIPYMDENTDPALVTNDEDARTKIIDDLKEGTTLDINMGAIGRFNKTVSQVFLAKALMQMNHDYTAAQALLTEVVTSGKKPNGADIGLAPTYGEIFDIANRNGIESVYTVQYSVNDGSGAWNSSVGDVLNFPYKGGGSPGGCCGFFNPTQEFVNSFRTSGGLPLLDGSYNTLANAVKNDFGLAKNSNVDEDTGLAATDPDFTPDAGPLDPRLDWSVGRRGIPYWDWGLHTGADWIRDQTYSGPYNPKKAVYKKSQEKALTDISSWTSGYTANGYRMIRYADVLLLLAECQIENNQLDAALANINAVRTRAANAAGWVKKIDADLKPTDVNAANYVIATYPTLGTQENARVILQMERKLELGMEGHRFFDLNRWGNTVPELNRVLTYEKTMPWGNKLYGAATVGTEDIRYPIPLRQIDLSVGRIKQNEGH